MSKKAKFVGKPIEISGQFVQFDNHGDLRYCGDSDPEYCDLIATKKEVAKLVTVAKAFVAAQKLEAKIGSLSGEFELEAGNHDRGIDIGCTFVSYQQIVEVFGKVKK